MKEKIEIKCINCNKPYPVNCAKCGRKFEFIVSEKGPILILCKGDKGHVCQFCEGIKTSYKDFETPNNHLDALNDGTNKEQKVKMEIELDTTQVDLYKLIESIPAKLERIEKRLEKIEKKFELETPKTCLKIKKFIDEYTKNKGSVTSAEFKGENIHGIKKEYMHVAATVDYIYNKRLGLC